MSMAEMTQEELVQEVLDRVFQSSTGVEDLETVTSLSGTLTGAVAVLPFMMIFSVSAAAKDM